MRLVSFCHDGRASFGVLREDGIVDVGAKLGVAKTGLHDLLRRAGGEEAQSFLDIYAHAPADYALADVELTKPLLNWGKCFCVGVNYPERNEEYRDGSAAPLYPSLFVRFPESFVGPGQPLVRPPESAQLDYEGEIVMVIGHRGRRIAAADWADHVFGWTLGNEGTIRDWVRHGKFNVTPGKNWAASGALGPVLVTRDEAGDGPFEIVTRVNGEERQRDSTARMTFSFGRIVEYVSTFCTLEPGDVIFTGTPAGAGARREPPVWLKPGDVVEVEASGLGKLVNGVTDE
jgi:2-keto-4-pentenoate hydratase/2-oxohepta-3-ene-1,7-dioic acid hydratase in catechol pathway